MSGVAKAIKKVFKKVVNVVKKIWKPLLIAAAVYFTAGLALSAFPATASFAASMPGFAGGGFLGTGIGAGATAGTGIFSTAAAKLGLGALGSAGGLAGGAMAAGTSASALGAAGFSTAAIAEGASAAIGSTLAAGDAILGAGAAGAASTAAPAASSAVASTAAPTAGSAAAGGATTHPALAIGGVGSGTGGAAAGGMTLGEKILLASSGTQALGVLMQPDPAEKARWEGAFYGTYYDGGGSGPVTPPQTQPGAQGAPKSGSQPVQPSMVASNIRAPNEVEQTVQGNRQNQSKAPIVSSTDLFSMPKPNPKVRYV